LRGCGYGTPITAYYGNEYVYKVLTKENPANDGSGFTGVFTLVDNGVDLPFEFLYGHCDPSVKVGQILAKGEVLGTESNNGEVYVRQNDGSYLRITLEMQKNGDQRGSHRHDQKRLLIKVPVFNNKYKYIIKDKREVNGLDFSEYAYNSSHYGNSIRCDFGCS